MRISKKALRRLVKEAIDSNRIISERPWSVEYTFKMKGGAQAAEDSEGPSADGFAINMESESGTKMRIIIDSYWNPQTGDQSGNSIKVEVDGSEVEGGSSYVPHKFDDGKSQRIMISNTPVSGIVAISHAIDEDSLPIVYLTVPNPFDDDDDINFELDIIGNGEVDVEMSKHINI